MIVKKIRYRSARFTARDVFDLAAVAQSCPALPAILRTEVSDAIDRTREAVAFHAARGLDALDAAVILTESGRTLLPQAFEIARRALAAAQRSG